MSAATAAEPGRRTRQLGGDFAAMTGGWVVRVGLGVLVSVLVARYLAPDDTGRYAFLLWLAGLLAVGLSLGFPTAVTRYTAEAVGGGHPRAAGALLRVVVRWQATLAVVAAVLLAAGALVVSRPWRLPLVFTALSMPALVLHGSLSAFLSGLQAFRWQALLGVGALALQLALFGLVLWGAAALGLWGATCARFRAITGRMPIRRRLAPPLRGLPPPGSPAGSAVSSRL